MDEQRETILQNAEHEGDIHTARKNELGPMIAEALACCPYHSQDAIADYIAGHIALNEKARTITEHEMAAGDLYSAAQCGLSTLYGLDIKVGGRISFIRGVLDKHSRYGIKADLAAGSV